MRRMGYRPKDRYLVFQTLEYTVAASKETVRILAKAHTARNTAEYEGYFEPDERLITDTITAAEWVANALAAAKSKEA